MVMMGGGGGWSTMRALREEETVKQHKLTRGTFKRVTRFARPYRRDIVFFLLTIIVSAVIGVATPVLAGDVVNAITGREPDAGGQVVRLAMIIALLAVANAGLSLVQRWFSSKIG